MGKVEIRQKLRKLNPDEDWGQICIYADLYLDYQAAQANIDEHGTIVFHPKTGAPITNPFLVVRDSCGARLAKSNLDTGDLWPKPL